MVTLHDKANQGGWPLYVHFLMLEFIYFLGPIIGNYAHLENIFGYIRKQLFYFYG